MNEEDEMWNDPDNWKWGLFYYNPYDKRLFVPKKLLQLGLTLNFGNPYSYLIIILFTGSVILLTRLGS